MQGRRNPTLCHLKGLAKCPTDGWQNDTVEFDVMSTRGKGVWSDFYSPHGWGREGACPGVTGGGQTHHARTGQTTSQPGRSTPHAGPGRVRAPGAGGWRCWRPRRGGPGRGILWVAGPEAHQAGAAFSEGASSEEGCRSRPCRCPRPPGSASRGVFVLASARACASLMDISVFSPS